MEIKQTAKNKRVRLRHYANEVEITGVDSFLTELTGIIHYTGVDVDFLEGKRKVNNCEPFTEKDIITDFDEVSKDTE